MLLKYYIAIVSAEIKQKTLKILLTMKYGIVLISWKEFQTYKHVSHKPE